MKRRLRLIVITFCVSALLMGLFSFYALRQFSSLISYSSQVDHTNRVIAQLYEIENLIKETDINERGYIITHDSNYIKELYHYNDYIIPATSMLKSLIQTDTEQVHILSGLRYTLLERRDIIRNNISRLDTATAYTIKPYFLNGRAIRDSSIQALNAMRHREAEVLEQRFQNKEYYQQFTFRTLVILIVAFGLTTIFLFAQLLQELKRRMRYQEELQLKVADLSRSHAELEQIAHAVSHDLQEPVRKIRVFTDRLLREEGMHEPNGRHVLERIDQSARRMHGLVTDLISLTSLLPDQQMVPVHLNDAVESAIEDIQAEVDARHASVTIADLPVITGYPAHLKLLFRALLDNALKFSKEDVPPVITITGEKITGDELDPGLALKPFYRISIADNGIGFDNQFISKIFQIFQRLHNQQSDYAGKGIGLAMCQRIMVNHGGAIRANGIVGAGATFYLFFPVRD